MSSGEVFILRQSFVDQGVVVQPRRFLVVLRDWARGSLWILVSVHVVDRARESVKGFGRDGASLILALMRAVGLSEAVSF